MGESGLASTVQLQLLSMLSDLNLASQIYLSAHISQCAIQNQNLKCWGNDIFTNQTIVANSIIYVATPTVPTNFTYTASTKYLLTNNWLITLDNGVVRRWGIKAGTTHALGEIFTGLESGVTEIYGVEWAGSFCVRKNGQFYCLALEATSLPAPDTSIPASAQVYVTISSICYYSGNTLMCKGSDCGQFGNGNIAAPAAGSSPTCVNRSTPVANGF